MRYRIWFLSLSFAASLLVSGDRSHASDLEQCESAKADEQQGYEACDRVQRDSSTSPRDRARALFHFGRLVQWTPDGIERAISAWDAAIAADPSFVPAIVARAEWFILSNRGHDATKLLLPALAANPGDIDPLVMIGRAYANAGIFDQALRSFDEALKLDPQHVLALFESGKLHERRGNFGEAAEAYKKAGQRYDPSAVPKSGHGIEHPYLAAARNYDRLGEADKALPLITSVIDHAPANFVEPFVFERRASYYEMLGLNSEAIADITSALGVALPHEHTPLLFRRAILYQKTGKHEEAKADFSKALRNGDRRAVLRMQVHLRNHGYTEVEINGVADANLLKSISACLAATKCGAGLGRPI